jgi:hypothetical protein
MYARWPLAEALSNQPISDSFTFKVGIAQYRSGKVVSAWRMNAISIWRYSLYGRGIKIASVTSHEYLPNLAGDNGLGCNC